MRKLIWPVLFLFLFILRGAGSVFYSGWLSVDLPLLGVYAHALFRGSHYGVMSGAIVGLFEDAMVPGLFGYPIITRSILGHGIGRLKGRIFKENSFYHLPLIGAVSLALRAIYLFFAFALGMPVTSLVQYASESFGFACGNMLFVLPIIYLCHFTYNWIKEEDRSY